MGRRQVRDMYLQRLKVWDLSKGDVGRVFALGLKSREAANLGYSRKRLYICTGHLPHALSDTMKVFKKREYEFEERQGARPQTTAM